MGQWLRQILRYGACACCLVAPPLVGQAAEPPARVEAALQSLFRGADIVFTGEVFSIERAEGAVTVRWQVEDAIRGTSGGEYVLREWAGLWTGGSARYVVGERALVLLHAPSLAGFASPVGGLDGVIPLRGDAAGSVLDLRWLALHAAVTDAARLRPMRALRAARAIEPAGDTGTVPLDPAGDLAPAISYAQVDGAVVLSMLHAWQRASGGVH